MNKTLIQTPKLLIHPWPNRLLTRKKKIKRFLPAVPLLRRALTKKLFGKLVPHQSVTKRHRQIVRRSTLRSLPSLKKKLTTPTPQFLNITVRHNTHPAPFWTLAYLNSISHIKLMGRAPSLESYSIDHADFLDERAPYSSFDRYLLNTTNVMTERLASLDLNPNLRPFLTIAAMKAYSSEVSTPHKLSLTNLKVLYKPQSKSHITSQPYNYLGLRMGLQNQKPSHLLRSITKVTAKIQKKLQPQNTLNPSLSLYGVVNKVPFKEFDKAWSMWVKRTLRFRKLDTSQLNSYNTKPQRKVIAPLSTWVREGYSWWTSPGSLSGTSLRYNLSYKRKQPKYARTTAKYFRYRRLKLTLGRRNNSNLTVRIYPFLRKWTKALGSISAAKSFVSKQIQKQKRFHLWKSPLTNRYVRHKLKWLWSHNFKRSFGAKKVFMQNYSQFDMNTTVPLKLNSSINLNGLQKTNKVPSPTPRVFARKLAGPNRTYNVLTSQNKLRRLLQNKSLYRRDLSWNLRLKDVFVKSTVCNACYLLPAPCEKPLNWVYRQLLSKAMPYLAPQLRLTIEPLTTSQFTRSPLFFLHLTPLKTTVTDVLFSIERLKQTPSYLVFPDANDLKVSIFRRLNEQKSFFNSRIFKKATLDTRYLGKVKPVSTIKGYDSNRRPLFQPTAEKSSILTHLLNVRAFKVSPSPYVNPKIKRIRFKPGYGRIWRAGRKSIREILGYHNRYQYRLSPKLQALYFSIRKANFQTFHSTNNLGFALMTSRFIPDSWSLNGVLSSGSVFLNGSLVTNPEIRLFVNDFIQLIVHIKFYITWKWIQNYAMIRKNRVNKVFYRKFRPSVNNKDIKVVRPLPLWFYDLQYSFADIPRFFEVDYFTLSVFVLYDELPLEKWTPSRAKLFDPLILNMYNWKYIT